MKIELQYGRTGLEVTLPDKNVTVVEPVYRPGLPDEEAALVRSLKNPIGTEPLSSLVRKEDKVAIAFCDITRPIPNDRVLPPILRELEEAGVPDENIVLINALGMHRKNTDSELMAMLGPELTGRYRIVQIEATEEAMFEVAGILKSGKTVKLNKEFLSATFRILTGFIEPHFFAGYSGGPKLVIPGMASWSDIMYIHSAGMIGHPKATWGVLEGNPIQEAIREVADLVAPDFIVNVALNRDRQITGVFSGDLKKAHAEGVEFVRKQAMRPVKGLYDIVITTNSGYPLDQNLYQAVKGMSAAAQVVKPGGAIIAAAECSDGVPDHGNYKKLLHSVNSPRELLERINSPGFEMTDQWEAQAQALIQLKAKVYLKNSRLTDDEVRAALLEPCHSIEETLDMLLGQYGPDARICVLPEGPQTIPYVT